MPVGGDVIGQRLVEIELIEVDIDRLAKTRQAVLRRLWRSLAASIVSPKIALIVNITLPLSGLAAQGHHVLAHIVSM